MGRLFCLSVFGRKNKAAKDVLYTDMAQKSEALPRKRDCVVRLPEHFLNAELSVQSIVNTGKSNEALNILNTAKHGILTGGSTNNTTIHISESAIVDGQITDCRFPKKVDFEKLDSIAEPPHLVILIKDKPYKEISNIVETERALCHEDHPSREKTLDRSNMPVFAENVAGKNGDSDVDHELLHSKKMDVFSIGECSDDSELGSSDGCRMEPSDSLRSTGVENMSPTMYYATGKQKAFEEHYRAGIFLNISNDCEASTANANLLIDRSQCDDLLSGHVSDPGVYQREDMQSFNGSPILNRDGSSTRVVGEGSVSYHNHDDISNISKSVPSGDVTDNLSVRTNEQYPGTISDRMESLHPLSEMHVSGSPINSWKDYEAFNQELCQMSVDAVENVEQHTILVDHNANQVGGFAEKGLQDKYFDKMRLANANLELASDGVIISDIQRDPVSGFENSFRRVEQWINAIEQSDLVYEEETVPAFEAVEEVVEMSSTQLNPATPDSELGNAALRTLNAFATVAHFNGIGLRDVPSLGHFNCLKTLNLSGNFITRVPAGCLPQSLHILDLSRNKISQIEGFRDLTRLRTLDLSHNRISKIGHGLANCTLIKELYLAGNKIAEVEGLHRLLKLTLLDLSHNKIATSKGVGQLAANYSSLLALNLVGNPILTNIGDEQLRKLVTSLAPHVTYLNKQAIKTVSVRESVVDTVARAALGNNRNNRSSGNRSRNASLQPSSKKPPPSHRIKDGEKKQGSNRTSKHHHHHHHHHHHRNIDDGRGRSDTDLVKMGVRSVTPPQERLHTIAFDTGIHPIHRSMSDSVLQEE